MTAENAVLSKKVASGDPEYAYNLTYHRNEHNECNHSPRKAHGLPGICPLVTFWCQGVGEGTALAEMAQEGFAPHCPLVVGAFTTPSLGAQRSQHSSRKVGLRGTEGTSSGGWHVG